MVDFYENYLSMENIMRHIPLELQKHILSYLTTSKENPLSQPYTHYGTYFYYPLERAFNLHKRGRCICTTRQGKRCKRIIFYTQRLVCTVHKRDNFVEEILNSNYCN